jgi:hypothetical protein
MAGVSTGGGGSTAGGSGSTGGGPPETQCVPAAEICNGTDDNCDGEVDEGCPSSFAWSNAVDEDTLGDGFGGSYFPSSCETNEVLVGLRTNFGRFFSGMGALCSAVAVQPTDELVPYDYQLSLGEPRHVPGHGDEGTTTDLLCNPGSVVVGIRAALQNYSTGTTDFVVLTRAWIECAPFSMDGLGKPIIDTNAKYEKGGNPTGQHLARWGSAFEFGSPPPSERRAQ